MLACNRVLHIKLLDTIFRAPIAFFDSNPIGRILNRFSKDQAVMDTNLILVSSDTYNAGFLIIGLTIIIIIINPLILVPLGFVLVGIVIVRKKIVPLSREARRLELVTKSPIFSDYSSSLRGIITVRAYQYESWLLDQMKEKIHNNIRCTFSYQTTIRAF
ncbi:MAG: ABC transporter transmembrane domain-containing protein [Kangiellaceae bacterium]|jgi:ABC-type bacteriocin/lantibiotic exporter with double-glycine peptidase domain|nr:ABC transporter transmembrane domain-containing protein [Kangiellaceae bacterium]